MHDYPHRQDLAFAENFDDDGHHRIDVLVDPTTIGTLLQINQFELILVQLQSTANLGGFFQIQQVIRHLVRTT